MPLEVDICASAISIHLFRPPLDAAPEGNGSALALAFLLGRVVFSTRPLPFATVFPSALYVYKVLGIHFFKALYQFDPSVSWKLPSESASSPCLVEFVLVDRASHALKAGIPIMCFM